MPFLPLLIVIAIFLATSKILQPSRSHLQPASEDYSEQMLNQALIDYIARESRKKAGSEYGTKTSSKSGKYNTQRKQQR
ncbi:MAG: hypothetical protein AAF572_14295 [Cyanobacteria bacterium P01_B01_bin.77]